MNRIMHNAKIIGSKPYSFCMTLGPRTKKMRPTLLDKNGGFIDYMSLTGNAKQRRQQQRKMIRELNQGAK